MAVKIYTLSGIKLFGESKAEVIDSYDPNRRNYIRINSPVFGRDTGYIPFINDPCHYFPPVKGGVIYVSADGGDPSYPIAHGSLVTGYDFDEGNSLYPDLPINFRREIPTCRGIFTPGLLDTNGKPYNLIDGHLLEFDDGEATFIDNDKKIPTISHSTTEKGVRLTTSAGNKIHIYEELDGGTSKNYIKLEFNSGHPSGTNTGVQSIMLDGNNGNIYIDTTNSGSVIILGDGTIDNLATKEFVTELYDKHTHPTGVGPSGLPSLISTVEPNKSYTTKTLAE